MVVASDRLRKELTGTEPTRQQEHGWRVGPYSDEVTRRTYTALLSRARQLLQMGESVVVDASFADPADRVSARAVADEGAARLVELRCDCPPDVAADRIIDRWGSGDLSEATVAVAERMRSSYAIWPQASVVNTSTTLAAAMAQLPPMDSAGPRVASRLTGAGAPDALARAN